MIYTGSSHSRFFQLLLPFQLQRAEHHKALSKTRAWRKYQVLTSNKKLTRLNELGLQGTPWTAQARIDLMQRFYDGGR